MTGEYEISIQPGHIARHTPRNAGAQGCEAAVVDIAQDLLLRCLHDEGLLDGIAIKGNRLQHRDNYYSVLIQGVCKNGFLIVAVSPILLIPNWQQSYFAYLNGSLSPRTSNNAYWYRPRIIHGLLSAGFTTLLSTTKKQCSSSRIAKS